MIKNTLKKLNIKRLNESARRLRRFLYDSADLFIALPCRIFTRRRDFDGSGIKKILIIRNDRIGDLILSTPALRAVRETHPRCEIHLLINEYTKDLVINNPDINKLLTDEQMLDKDYDMAIALLPGYHQNYLTFKSGASFRAGYTGWGGGFFLTHKIKDDRATRIRHEVLSALEITGLFGCKTLNTELNVSVTNEGERFAEDFFRENSLNGSFVIIIHPGSSQEYIRWNKDNFAAVADYFILEHRAKIVLLGSKNEKPLLEHIASKMSQKTALLHSTALTNVVSALKRSNLFIGHSTGPMHIAAALKVPVTAIFGSAHPLDSFKEWGPWNTKNAIVSLDLGCKDCHPTDCKTFDCMKLIKPEDVIKAAESLIEWSKRR